MIEWRLQDYCPAETYFGTGGFHLSKHFDGKYVLEKCMLYSRNSPNDDIDFHLVGRFDSIDDAKAAAELLC